MKNLLFSSIFIIVFCFNAMAAGVNSNATSESPVVSNYVLILNFYRGINDWASNIQNHVTQHLRNENIPFFLKYMFLSTTDTESHNPSWWNDNMSNIPSQKPKAVFILSDAGWL